MRALDSHKLIEEFMVLANVAAAEHLEEKRKPCMYRVHDQPSPEKISAFADVMESIGVRFARGQTVTPKRFNQILERVKDGPNQHMVNEIVLRSQAQATYSPDNLGHFGLGLRRYCHFTSPIRRYADLLVHRALVTNLKPSAGALGDGDGDNFADIGEHLSVTERRAAVAERDSVDRYTAQYLAEQIGASFAGRITGVTRFGLFVILDGIGADGLVPIRSLPADYYDHDEARHMLEGRQNGKKYRLGDAVEVTLSEAMPVTGGMIFHLADSAAPSMQRHRGPKKGKSKGRKHQARREKRKNVSKRRR